MQETKDCTEVKAEGALQRGVVKQLAKEDSKNAESAKTEASAAYGRAKAVSSGSCVVLA